MANGLMLESPGNGNHSNNLSAHLRRIISVGGNNGNSIFQPDDAQSSKQKPVESQPNSRRKTISPETQALLLERDSMWRQHERAQILFIQDQHAKTLAGLHQEIEQSYNRCRELSAALCGNLDKDSVIAESLMDGRKSELEKQLRVLTEEFNALKEENERREQKIQHLQAKLLESEDRYHQDMIRNGLKIKEVSQELSSKAGLLSQLSSQLHHLRLKEAVQKQKEEQEYKNRRTSEYRRTGFSKPPPLSPTAISVQIKPPRRSASLNSDVSLASSDVTIRRHSVRVSTGSSQSWKSGDSHSFLPPIHLTENVPSGKIGNIEKPTNSAGIGSFVRSPFRRSKEFKAKQKSFEEET